MATDHRLGMALSSLSRAQADVEALFNRELQVYFVGIEREIFKANLISFATLDLNQTN